MEHRGGCSKGLNTFRFFLNTHHSLLLTINNTSSFGRYNSSICTRNKSVLRVVTKRSIILRIGRGIASSFQVHVCEVCGSEHVQWVGRCPTCKEWNSVKPFKVRREHQGALDDSFLVSLLIIVIQYNTVVDSRFFKSRCRYIFVIDSRWPGIIPLSIYIRCNVYNTSSCWWHMIT